MRMSIILIFPTVAYHKLMNVLKSQYELIRKDRDMTVAAWSCCKSGALQTMQSLFVVIMTISLCITGLSLTYQNNEVWWEVPWYFSGLAFCMKGCKITKKPLLIRFTWPNWKKAIESSCLMTSHPRVVSGCRWWDDGHRGHGWLMAQGRVKCKITSNWGGRQ